MHYLKRLMRTNGEDGVSPVVGVMLMLIVTIIIAAVVSAFAGGLVGGNNQKTPTVTMEVNLVNSSAGMNFSATVLSVSEPIPTKNLQLTTNWVNGKSSYGGGNSNTKIPYGYGPGVSGTPNLNSPNANQTFGNYTLTQGTGLVVSDSDIATLFGSNCHNLNIGDTVTLRMIYTPTGKTVWQQNVVVTGSN